MVAFSAILPNQVGFTLRSENVHLMFTRLVGTGAYGLVYLAQDMSSPADSPQTFAVKVMLKFEPNSDLEAHQKREIACHQSLHHPSICELHHVIEGERYVYLVMDYHEGGDLFSAIIDRQIFARNDEMVKSAFVQLLDAVETCHQRGISHRDLKPENVLCSVDGSRLYLSDFGLATESTRSTSFGCGSSFYMSPECVGSPDQPIPYSTRRSDIWSLGVILTNMLSGRNPWRLAVPHDNGYMAFLDEGVNFLHRLLPISQEAADILGRIFDTNPATRISLPELRASILAAKTLFSRDDEPTRPGFGGCQERAKTSQSQTDETVLDVTFDFTAPSSSSRTTQSVSINIRLPSVEVTRSTFINQSFDDSESDSSSEGPTTPVNTSLSCIPTLTLDVGKPYERAIEEYDVQERERRTRKKRSLRDSSVTRKVHRFVEAIHKMTART